MSAETLATVASKLKSGEYASSEPKSKPGSSDVWKFFNHISDVAKKERIDYVQCRDFVNCGAILKYKKGSSPTNLRKHGCFKRLNAPVQHGSVKKIKLSIPDSVKKNVTEKCAEFVAKDLRSFDTVEGEGFKKLAECLIQTGVQLASKNFDINEIIPHSTTVSRQVKKMHENSLKEFVLELKPTIEKGDVSATTDMWTESATQESYLTFTVHWIDDVWEYHSRVLFTVHVPNVNKNGDELKKTAENIVRAIQTRLSEIGLPDTLPLFKMVTDQGSNMIKAFKNQERLNCTAHILNIVLRHSFSPKKNLQGANRLADIITKCKSLVEYFKRTGKNSLLLDGKLVQEVETRWNTKFDMLVRIAKHYETVKDILKESKCMTGVDKGYLNRLCVFLKQFKRATKILEADNRPTIHLVLWQIKKLQDHLEDFVKEETEDDLKHFARTCSSVLKEKFKPNNIHKIASFLWHDHKQMKYLSEEEREEVYRLVKEELASIASDQTEYASEDNSVTTSGESQDEDDLYLDNYRDDPPKSESNMDLEIEIYRTKVVPPGQKDILQWWKMNSAELPLLSTLVKKILAIPATSSPSERCFSSAGWLIQKRRTCLAPTSVDACLYLHSAKKV